jgi:glucosamine--fructose-6-phosphate aminotransferase (isomerizing)
MGTVTLQEILNQPKSWESVLNRIQNIHGFVQSNEKVCHAENFFFIGCGTSYYLALSAANVFQSIAQRRARAITASDVYLFPESVFWLNKETGVNFIISRSGTTTEALWAAQKINTFQQFSSCAVSCRPKSTLVKECHLSLTTPEADEKSVVMTQSFTSMLLLLQLIASHLCKDTAFENDLTKVPEIGEMVIKRYHNQIKDLAQNTGVTKYTFLGQGPFYGLACESMLKMKEMSLSVSEAYHSMEFRHGPMSMVDEQMLITFLLSNQGRDAEVAVLKDMKNLGAKTLVICDSADENITKLSDHVIELQSGLSDHARLVLYMPLMQLFGYYQATQKGLDPDHPKNLTQTVEIK